MNKQSNSTSNTPTAPSANAKPGDLKPSKDAKGGISLLLPAVQKVRSAGGG